MKYSLSLKPMQRFVNNRKRFQYSCKFLSHVNCSVPNWILLGQLIDCFIIGTLHYGNVLQN